MRRTAITIAAVIVSTPDIAFIGFGEAAMAFAAELRATMIAYDLRVAEESMLADLAKYGVTAARSNAEAVEDAGLILSLVTADQALTAARETARSIARDALYCDMNSVAPETKRAARDEIEGAGAHYVDVAVMAPVLPARLHVPLLVGGPHAQDACVALSGWGFRPRVIDGEVGIASAVKMVRSILVKGMEALTAECFLAAHAAGITEEVAASLNTSWPGTDWATKADYNLDRMLVHGLRRAAEMEEVVRTIDALGTGSAMSRATAERQREIGALQLAPLNSLDAKTSLILGRERTTP